MYEVTIYYSLTKEACAQREFKFGTWAEIGFWLDHYGYNDPAYYVEVKFSC